VLSANHQNEPLSLKRESGAAMIMHAYNRRELKRLFGLSSATIQLLEQTGYLDPQTSGCYEFGDLVLLRTVGALHAAKLSARTINRALRHLKPWLSGEAHKGPISLRRATIGCRPSRVLVMGTAIRAIRPAAGS